MRSQTLAAAVLLVALAATTSGCGSPRQVLVAETAGSVTLAVGETLVVDLGEINRSIGDDWAITTEPDPAVLGAGEAEEDAESDLDGSYSHLTYRFEAVGAGTTTIGLTYRYRGVEGDPEGRAEDPTPELTVTVED